MTPTRTGAAATAWLLAAAVVAAMLLITGSLRDVSVLVLAVVQVVLHLLAVRSLGPSSPRRVAVLWSVQAGLTWLVAGDPTTTSVLVYAAIGFVFALVAEVVLRLVARFATVDGPLDEADEDDGPRGDPRPTDTAPLPVRDGEGSP